MASDAILLFAHGARDPAWAKPVTAVAECLRSRFPDRQIKVAFLEFMSPTLAEAVVQLRAGSTTSIDILPFFIAQGGHLRKELPEMLEALRASYPETQLHLLPPLGELPEVQAAMANAIAALVA